MSKYRPYSCTMTSAATLEAPKTLCRHASIDMSSLMPFSYGWPASISHRLSSSRSGRLLGRSPYTLFVEQWMNGASMQCSRTFCSRLSVPPALTSKSVNGSRTAQSWLGWAAVCTTTAMSRPYRVKIAPSAARSRMSVS